MKFLKILVVCLLPAFVFAQEYRSQISGKVTDENMISLPGVSILVLSHPDSKSITKTVTDSNGHFAFVKLLPGDYHLVFTMLGFQKKHVSVKLKPHLDESISSLTLESTVQELSTVKVEGRLRSVKMEAGSTIHKVDGESLALKPNVLELLRSLPGVIMNEEGSVSLNGKAGANVQINGRSIFFTGDQLINYLRALPSTSVNEIELITAPSAMHDAEGKAGLININTQKIMVEGWALNVNTGYEQHQNGRVSGAGRLTYQKNNVGAFIDYSHQSGRYTSVLNMFRAYIRSDNNLNQIIFIRQHSSREEDNKGNRLGIGLDYALDDKITFGLSSSGNFFGKNYPGYTEATFNTNGNALDSILYTRMHSNQEQKVFSGGGYLNYKGDKNTTADLSFDYLSHLHKEDLLLKDEMMDRDGLELGRNTKNGNMNGNIRMFSLQMNGVRMISSVVKIVAGAKFVSVDIVNEDALSGISFYSENINSGYVQTNVKAGHFDFEGGVRLEQTHLQNQNYAHFFPALKIQYTRNSEGDNLSFMYSKRITRPTYRDLSPFSYIWDEYTRAIGNPNLRSELTDNIEFAYLYRKSYRGTLFFANTKDPIMQNIEILNNNSALVYPDNFKRSWSGGLRLDVADLMLASFWRLGLNSISSYNMYGWKESQEYIRKKLLTFSIGTTSQLTLPKKWTSEISSFYNGRMVFGKATVNPHYSISVAIQKQVLNDRLTLRIYGNDILQSNRQNLEIDFIKNRIRASTRQFNDYRCIGLSLSFNFKGGQQKKNAVRETVIDQSKRINM